MTKKLHLFFTLIALLAISPSYGKLKQFELTIASNFINESSLYQEIEFVDARSEAEKKALKIDEDQFNNQLNKMLSNVEVKDTTTNTLIVHLRNLYIQLEDYDQERCYIRFSLYNNNSAQEGIFFINTLNTYLPMTDSNSKDQAALSDLLATFIYTHLIEQPKEYSEKYKLNELSDVINLEKARTPLYTTKKLADGIYNGYQSFINQLPDVEMSSFKSADSYVKDVKYIDPKSQKETKVKSKKTFAIVIDGNPYIQIKGKYYPLDKEDNDFLVRIQKSTSNSYGITFGLIGSVLMPYDTSTEYILLKMDHLDGSLSVKSKEIENTTNHLFSKKPLRSKKKTIEGNESMKKW